MCLTSQGHKLTNANVTANPTLEMHCKLFVLYAHGRLGTESFYCNHISYFIWFSFSVARLGDGKGHVG